MTTATDRVTLQQPTALVAALLVLLGAALFGTIGPLSRPVYAAGVSPFAFVAWRVGWGALFFSLVVAARAGWSLSRLGIRGLGVRAWRPIAAASAFEVVVNLAIFAAFARTSVALALFVLYTFPALVAAALVILGKERLDRVRIAALGLATLGVVGVVAGGIDPAAGLKLDAVGLVFAAFAAIGQASFIVVSRDGFGPIPANTAMASIMIATTIVAAIATVIADGAGALVHPFGDPPVLALLVAMGAFASAVPFFLFVSGIHRLGGIRTGILMLFEPVVGVSLAAVFLRELVTLPQVLGGATVLAAAALVQRGSPHGHDVVPDLVVRPEIDEGVTFHPPGGP